MGVHKYNKYSYKFNIEFMRLYLAKKKKIEQRMLTD